MSDLWAYCTPCARWFYVDTDGATTSDHLCPVCETPSRRAVDHAPMVKGV
jgi:hypothetical protein